MKKINCLLLVLLVSTLAFKLHAQVRTFDNVIDMRLRNSGPIVEKSEVRGYYFFYALNKSKKGKRTYLLRILDENLNDFKTKTIEESKSFYLAEGAYNGSAILLKFIDFSKKKLVLMTYDKNAELISKIERDVPKSEMIFYRAGSQFQTNSLYDIPGKGFVNYSYADKGRTYAMKYVPTEKDGKEWIRASNNKKTAESASFLSASDQFIYSLVAKRKSLLSKNIKFDLSAIDIATGKPAFRISLNDNKYSTQPLTAFYDKATKELNLMGMYYPPNTKVIKNNGLGLFNYKIDTQGKVVSKTYRSWSKDFRKFVKVDPKGRVISEDKNGFIYFHNIQKASDGSIIAIGEQYKKVADAAGIASKLLVNGYANTTKIVVNDIALFHFTPEFEVKSIEFVQKSKSNITLPYGSDFMNVHVSSLLVKAYGGFDYAYTSNNEKEGAMSIGYLDYEKIKGEKKQWIFGASTYYDGEFTQDKIKLGRPKSSERLSIYRAKPGYVAVVEYSKKLKKLDVRLEKINY